MLAFERLNTTFDDNLDKLAQIKVIPRFPNGGFATASNWLLGHKFWD
jgi:hypothetical protein